MRGGRSRNKVAVGEPAAGSPPIYSLFKIMTYLRQVLNKLLSNSYFLIQDHLKQKKNELKK